MSRQKIIILLSILGVIVLAVGLYGIFLNKNGVSNANTPGGEEVVDPVSGETIYKNSNLSQTNKDSPNPSQPVMLGFGKLNDYGMSYDQTQKISYALSSFAMKQKPAITQISLYKDSYRQQLPDDTGISHITFSIRANEKTDYYVVTSYSGTADAITAVYADDKTTLLFTQ